MLNSMELPVFELYLYLFTSLPLYLFTSLPLYLFTSLSLYLFTSLPLYLFTSLPNHITPSTSPLYQLPFTSLPVTFHLFTSLYFTFHIKNLYQFTIIHILLRRTTFKLTIPQLFLPL